MTSLPSSVDIAIIGAGAAGLGAAHALKRAGVTFVVLEARDRVGGRGHTIMASPDVTFDLGRPVKFSVIRLKEAIRYGQRIDAFTVERWQSDSWEPIASSTGIGPRRLIRLDAPIIATRLRLRITQASASPALSEFAVFSEAAPG